MHITIIMLFPPASCTQHSRTVLDLESEPDVDFSVEPQQIETYLNDYITSLILYCYEALAITIAKADRGDGSFNT